MSCKLGIDYIGRGLKVASVLALLIVLLGLVVLPQRVYATEKTAANPTVSGENIYANGTTIFITEGTSGGTTIYIDTNKNGSYDADTDQSLKTAGITDAPADDESLVNYTIYGGYQSGIDGATELDGDTNIIMTGGAVNSIIGGGYNTKVSGSTNITVSGGNVINIYGGSYDGVVTGTASVIINDGKVGENVYGGGHTESSSVGSSTVNITGGTIGDSSGVAYGYGVYGAGYQGKVVGTASVIITGGTVQGNVYGGGYNDTATTGSKTITVGGTAVIGDSANGIRLGYAFNKVESFVVGADLQVGAEINVVTDDDYKVGSIIASDAVSSDIDYIKITRPNAHYGPYLDNTEVKLKKVPIISAVEIYANGVALLIVEDGSGTTIYLDDNRNGIKDVGEESLEEAKIESAPDNQADLSSWSVYGGFFNENLNGDTLITMTGGIVKTIFGGGNFSGSTITGNTNINISGGNVTNVYGGGNNASVTGEKNVTVGEDAKIGSSANSTGIRLDKDVSEVEPFKIAPDLNDTAKIYVRIADSHNTDDIIATGALAADLDNISLNNNTNNYQTYISNLTTGTVRAGILPSVGTTDGNTPAIYGNGNALVIAADGNGTTVYLDDNKNGSYDSGEPSLQDLGITNAPGDGADLSSYTIFGGSYGASQNRNTMISMTGGRVKDIYGGNYTGNLNANTTINITGGNISNVYGGNMTGGTVSGNKTVTVGGSPKIGDANGHGISMYSENLTNSRFNIAPALTSTAEIYLILSNTFAEGSTIANGAQRGDELLIKLNDNPNGYGAYLDGTEIKAGTLPTISTQPTGVSYAIGVDSADVKPLEVASNDTGVTYQWYKSSTNSTRGGIIVNGADKKTFTPSINSDDTSYYYCLITGTNGASITSKIVAVTIEPIQIIKGGNQTIMRGQSLSAVSNDRIDMFQRVEVDGNVVDAQYYSSEPGSIKITLSGEYTKTLALGTHTLSIISEHGTATTEFYIIADPTATTTTDPSIAPLTGVYLEVRSDM